MPTDDEDANFGCASFMKRDRDGLGPSMWVTGSVDATAAEGGGSEAGPRFSRGLLFVCAMYICR